MNLNTNLLLNNNHSQCHDVKLSVIADIGGSSFTYGIRNMKEVFVFPKYWYRSSLARRLFLGEETATTSDINDINSDAANTMPSSSSSSSAYVDPNINMKYNRDSESPIKSATNTNSNGDHANKQKSLQKQYNHKYDSDTLLNVHNWQTLVLISVNLAELEVKMNFGTTLGEFT